MNSSAFTFFEAGLEDINEHLTVAEYVNAHTTAVVSRAYENFLRDAVIKTVGNIDAYFSKIILSSFWNVRQYFHLISQPKETFASTFH